MKAKDTIVLSVVAYCLIVISTLFYVRNTVSFGRFDLHMNIDSIPLATQYLCLLGMGAFISFVILISGLVKTSDNDVTTLGDFFLHERVRYPRNILEVLLLFIITSLRATIKITIVACFGALFDFGRAVSMVIFFGALWFIVGRSFPVLWFVVSFSCWFTVGYFAMSNWFTKQAGLQKTTL